MSSPSNPGESDDEPQSPQFVDPNTGKPVKIADMRAEFERLSRQTPRDPAAERAFIQSKIEMIRGDSHLSAKQKEDAIAELQRGTAPR
jgi:hypothetical protein